MGKSYLKVMMGHELQGWLKGETNKDRQKGASNIWPNYLSTTEESLIVYMSLGVWTCLWEVAHTGITQETTQKSKE